MMFQYNRTVVKSKTKTLSVIQYLLWILCFMGVTAAGQQTLRSLTRPKYWPIEIAGVSYPVMELALTDHELRRGLMNRESISPEGGMIFVFNPPSPRSFWMKNTLVPLDLIYVDRNGKVIGMYQMAVEKPRQPGETMEEYENRLSGYPSEGAVQVAIELKAGQIELLGLAIGDVIDLKLPELLKLAKRVVPR